ncbi:helix-turn-helix transcriptional regulator [Ancylobacter sonchi]|uniref:helix-turn-helix domain-containing protein n=1 Tax=Ancylobacter sonchi TaxID=1937790 RepID=UPI001BD349B8|nr:AraC family transcriptional regulator [Ancylobacter sonchi]MBS7535951.1 helix-turn-helix transcriptional regulator [Ancylobacter sonchi]
MPALLKSIPNEWGPKAGADAGAATLTRTGPNDILMTAPANLALVMLSPQPNREVALDSDRRTITLAPVGSLEIVPAGSELFARWVVAKENLLVALDQQRLARLAGEEFQNDGFELQPPRIGGVDRKALRLSQMLREEFQRGEHASELCFDALITLFATHLLRNYSSLRDRPDDRHSGGLSPRAWRTVNDFIQENLSQPLSIARLAEIAGLSPSHFLRAFRRSLGQAPHQYLLGQRLALVERLVTTTDLPFADIAAASGFSSNSHMTSTMKRLRGVTPTELRRGGL